MGRVPSDEHGVEYDAERPHIGGLARIRSVRFEDLGRHVGGTPSLILK